MSKPRAYQLIKHKQLVQDLETIVSKNDAQTSVQNGKRAFQNVGDEELFPEINEAQARELSKVEPEQQAEVLVKASEDGQKRPPGSSRVRAD